MQYTRVIISDRERWVFAMTKWEATVFAVVGKNKKAPADEQAVRFAVHDGVAKVWATDGSQLVCLEAKPRGPSMEVPPDCEMNVRAFSMKERASKARVNQLMLFEIGDTAVHTCAKLDLFDGVHVLAEDLGRLEESEALHFGRTQLDDVMHALGDLDSQHEGVGTWRITSRFASTFAAVAKATVNAEALCVNPPRHSEAPLAVRVEDDVDGALWTLAVMPMEPARAGLEPPPA